MLSSLLQIFLGIVLWMSALASLVFGLVGLVRGLRWAYAVGVLCGFVFSIGGIFSIGLYTLLWPVVILGQLLAEGRRKAIRLLAAAISLALWLLLLAHVHLPPF